MGKFRLCSQTENDGKTFYWIEKKASWLSNWKIYSHKTTDFDNMNKLFDKWEQDIHEELIKDKVIVLRVT